MKRPPVSERSLDASAALSILTLILLVLGACYCDSTFFYQDVPDGLPRSNYVKAASYAPKEFVDSQFRVLAMCQVNDDPDNCLWLGDRDVIDWADMPIDARLHLLSRQGAPNEPPILLAVSPNAGTEQRVIARDFAPSSDNTGERHIRLGFAIVFAAMGMLLLWRGRDEPSRWLAIFCICLAPIFAPYYGGVGNSAIVFVAIAVGDLFEFIAYIALYMMARSLALDCAPDAPRWMRVIDGIVAGMTAIAVGFRALQLFTPLSGVANVPLWPSTQAELWEQLVRVCVFMVLPLALMAIATAAAAPGAQRRRLKAISLTLAAGLSGPVTLYVMSFCFDHTWGHIGVFWCSLAAIPIGFAYAIPRYRALDVAFLNRVITYSLLTFGLALFLAGLETSMTFFVDSHLPKTVEAGSTAKTRADALPPAAPPSADAAAETNGFAAFAVDVLVAFVLIFSIGTLHTWLERALEHVFFRRQHEALRALAMLAREAPHADSPQHLYERIVTELPRHLACRGAAIYERRPGVDDVEEKVAGDSAFPELLSPDDALLWRMRAKIERVDTAAFDTPSALGSATAVPLCTSGALAGLLVVGARISETDGIFTPDELEALDTIATALVDAVAALRARENAAFVQDIATRNLSSAEILSRARKLASAVPAGAFDPLRPESRRPESSAHAGGAAQGEAR